MNAARRAERRRLLRQLAAQQRERRADARWDRRWTKALQERTVLRFIRRTDPLPYVWGAGYGGDRSGQLSRILWEQSGRAFAARPTQTGVKVELVLVDDEVL